MVARRNCLYFFALRNENVVVDVVQFEVFLLAVANGVADVAGVAAVVVTNTCGNFGTNNPLLTTVVIVLDVNTFDCCFA